MAMFRGAFSSLLAPGFRKVTFDSYKERPIEGRKLVNFQTSKRAYEEDLQMTGFGTLLPKPEGAQVAYQDLLSPVQKRYVWTTYGLGFRITMEMWEDDLYGVMGRKLSTLLGRSARNNAEVVMHSILNNAFNSAYSGYTPGEALVGAHVLRNGVTVRNSPSTPTDLSLPALQAAVEHFHQLTDGRGMPLVMIPRILVHSIGDYWLANQILKSPSLPGTNLNDVNQLKNEGLTPHLSHYMTDPDAWFVIADQHDMNYFERRPFTMANSDDFRTGDAEFRGLRRNGAGFGDWRGVYGSEGA